MESNRGYGSWPPPPTGERRIDHNVRQPLPSVQNEQEMINGQASPNGYQMSDASGLLSVYPFASATPTSHVARHLNNLTIGPQTSDYFHSVNLDRNGDSMGPLTSNDPRHVHIWQREGNHAIQLLQQQRVDSGMPLPQYPNPAWHNATPLEYDSHQTPAFAHGVLMHQYQQQYLDDNLPLAHPSSSSLAHALDRRIAPSTPSPTPPPPPPKALQVLPPDPSPTKQESAQFFDSFLKTTYSEISAVSQRSSIEPPPSTVSASPLTDRQPVNGSGPHVEELTPRKKHISSSPDPLLGTPVSPLKRKAISQMQSPSLKRQSSSSASSLTPLSTPSSIATSSTIRQSESPSKKRLIPFMRMPPLRDPHIPVPRLSDALTMSDDDLGGYGTPISSPTKSSSAKLSATRPSTGLRDDRQPLERFASLIEDIFEAEDALDPSSTELDSDFFSPHSSAASPRLSRTTISKLVKRIQKVSNFSQSRRKKSFVSGKSPMSHSVDGKGGMSQVDTTILTRVLRILDRSIKLAVDADISSIFPRQSAGTRNEGSDLPASPSKQKKSVILESEDLSALPTDKLDTLRQILNAFAESLHAAEAVISLLASDHLPKQMYSEDLISACIGVLKDALSSLIYPLMEGLTPSSLVQTHYSRSFLLAVLDDRNGEIKRSLELIHTSISAIIPLLTSLLNSVNQIITMSESIIIQMVYISIGPFFVPDAANDEGKGNKKKKVVGNIIDDAIAEDVFPSSSPLKGLRLNALALLRTVFSHYPDQRSWIVEEILTSLTKLPDIKHKGSQYRLRDGRSIHIVSALLLQLIQTSAHDVRTQASKLAAERQHRNLTLKRQDSSLSEVQSQTSNPSDRDYQEIQLYTSGLDSTAKLTRGIIVFLTKRSGKSKAAKTSNDGEYRVVFDNLMSDLITVLHWPEWPAASFILNIATRFLVSAVDDAKSNADVNSLKSLALDHLGVIAARLSEPVSSSCEDKKPKFSSWEKILSSGDVAELGRLVVAQREISAHLVKRANDDPAYHSARELTATSWGQRLALLHRDVLCTLDDGGANGKEAMTPEMARSFLQPVKDALRDVWVEGQVDVFDVGSSKEITRIDQLAEQVGSTQGFFGLLDAILNVVIFASDSTVVTLRTKALRALGQVVASNPKILKNPKVRRAIEGHMLDNSPAVRDATIELVGKYIVGSPELASDYYGKVADRIADTSLGVRKRVIKLLKTLFDISPQVERRSDICQRLALRMFDEDETVKDLAVKSLEELWFSDSRDDAIRWKISASGSVTAYDMKTAFTTKISVVMSTISKLRDRQLPEDLLHAIVTPKPGKNVTAIQERYSAMNDAFIDNLVDGSELPEHGVANSVRAIHAFTSANPSIISSSKASMLLPYLKNAQTAEELLICDFLLKIFRICIPRMPKTSIKFSQDLQQTLQPMILKPTLSGGISLLQESIACLCTVVQHLTHDYKILVGLLKSCNGRLKDYVSKDTKQLTNPTALRGLLGIVSIVALLAENCDFDQLRRTHEDLAAEINAVSEGPVSQHIYTLLLGLYTKFPDSSVKNRILPCLGFLFKAYPSLMTTKDSSEVMDAVFASNDPEPRAHLLRIMNSFLLSEMAKHTAAEKEAHATKTDKAVLNMEELVGNTQGFADSGVSSAIVQRYLPSILHAAVSKRSAEQLPAFDILSIIVKQGLAHPLQSMPAIISLETNEDRRLSGRALALHAILHTKHASLVNSRFLDCAKATYEYQRKLCPDGQVKGYHTEPDLKALLQPWYSLVRDKRSARQEFIKAMVKAFSVTSDELKQQHGLSFIYYMAEIIAVLEYKTLEEVLTVIRHLTSILSVSGMNLIEQICPASQQLRDAAETQAVDPAGMTILASESDVLLGRNCMALSVILILKGYLKQLYNLSEEKCGKWVPGKKSALGDKAAVKRNGNPITWDRMPPGSIVTVGDVESRKQQFVHVWQEDGVSAEPGSDTELQ